MDQHLLHYTQQVEECEKELGQCETELQMLQTETASLQHTIENQEVSPEEVLRLKRGAFLHSLSLSSFCVCFVCFVCFVC